MAEQHFFGSNKDENIDMKKDGEKVELSVKKI